MLHNAIILDCTENKLDRINIGSGEFLPLRIGATPWKNQDLPITYHPTYLNGGYFIQLPYVDISNNTQISISVTDSSNVYVAFNGDQQYDGGFKKSLPSNCWKHHNSSDGKDYITIEDDQMDMNHIYSRRVDKPTTILLPNTTTGATAMSIIVVSICEGKLVMPMNKCIMILVNFVSF